MMYNEGHALASLLATLVSIAHQQIPDPGLLRLPALF